MATHWYALHVKPHKERAVCDLLVSSEVVVFYPALKVKPVNPRSRRERPFFPGYMFVKVDLEQEGSNVLRWTEGVHGLVEFGGEPAVVPDNLVSELQVRLDQMKEESERKPEFKPGERVRITGGLFEGYDAIFNAELPGKDRVIVLLSFLSDNPKKLQVDTSSISKLRKNRWTT